MIMLSGIAVLLTLLASARGYERVKNFGCPEDFVDVSDFQLGQELWGMLIFNESEKITVFPNVDNRFCDKLISTIPDSITKHKDYTTFLSVLDKFTKRINNPDNTTFIEENDINVFVNKISTHPAMVKVEQYLKSSGKSCCTSHTKFLESFTKLWFRMHGLTVDKVSDPVFVGNKLVHPKKKKSPTINAFLMNYVGWVEKASNDKHGMYNWITFSKNQDSGKYLYKGTTKYSEFGGVKYVKVYFVEELFGGGYSKMDKTKFLVGVNPIVEIALYTACYFSANHCQFKIDDFMIDISIDRVCFEREYYLNKARTKPYLLK